MSALRNWPEDFVRGTGEVVDLVLDKADA